MKRFLRNNADYSFLIPACLFFLVFKVYPVFYNLVLSFKDVTLSNLIHGNQPFVGFQNYMTVMQNPAFQQSFINSIQFTLLCLFFQFIIGFSFALFYNKAFPGYRWMRATLLIAWMTPIVITGALFKWIFSGDFGVLNQLLVSWGILSEPVSWLTNTKTSLYAVIVANIWIGVPFNMIILMTGLQNLPESVYEAAKVDGANRGRQFFYITLPLMRPTIFILIMLGFIYSFKVFDIIYTMTGGGPANSSQILPYLAYDLSFSLYHFGEGAALSSIMLFLVGILALFYLNNARKEEVM